MERWSPERSISFHLSASVPLPPPLHQGTPGTRIYSAEHASLFFFKFLFFPLPVACSPCSSSASVFCSTRGLRHKWQPPKPRCSAADSLQWDLRGHLQPPGMAASSTGRDVLTAEASYVQTAAASGWKRWHLLTAFLSLPSPSRSSLPYQETRRTPAGRGLQG